MGDSNVVDVRLVFVSGICGSGKSSTAQEIAYQLQQNGFEVEWLHEECKNNPIRDTKKHLAESGCKTLAEYFDWTIGIWRDFIERIRRDSKVYVVDGYVFQSTVLGLHDDGCSPEAIQAYFARFAEVVKPVDPLVVSLYKTDLRESFGAVWRQRGNRWKRISIDIPPDLPEEGIDYRHYEEKGIATWRIFQELNKTLLESSSLKYLRIDTSRQEWMRYYQIIAEELDIPLVHRETVDLTDIRRYCGEYMGESREKAIVVKGVDGELYCEIFWPFMKLIPDSETQFHIRGLPINLVFHPDDAGEMKRFEFQDTYDWDLTGQVFARQLK